MKYILFIALLVLAGCKTDNTSTTSTTSSTKGKTESVAATNTGKTNYNKDGVPDACDLVSRATIARFVKKNKNDVNLNDGSSDKNTKARACFFKWDNPDIRNAGVMVSIQKNPVEEDVPDYLTYLIDGQISEGEQDFRADIKYKYKKWDGIGDAGAYSPELAKFMWRIGNEWSFLIAFNTTMTEKEQYRAATTISKEMMANLKRIEKQ